MCPGAMTTQIYTKTGTEVFTAALVIITKTENNANFPQMGNK